MGESKIGSIVGIKNWVYCGNDDGGHNDVDNGDNDNDNPDDLSGMNCKESHMKC